MTMINSENTFPLIDNVNFFLDADFFMIPSYRVSPFRTENVGSNSLIKDTGLELTDLFRTKFGFELDGMITSGGREAIELALESFKLVDEDIVSIITPSGNKYVSGCVTKSIEKYCKWDRKVSNKTKVIFVVHEFGKIYEDMDGVYSYGLPVIEDYAHALLSTPRHNIKSDFIIYSLPKALPIQYGGLLFSKEKLQKRIMTALPENRKNYINRVASYHFLEMEKNIEQQKENYKYLKFLFEQFGVMQFFEYKKNETPSVFMFTYDMDEKNGCLKEYLQSNGVECSYFYGSAGFFIPINYSLSFIELQHICALIINFHLKGKTNDNW